MLKQYKVAALGVAIALASVAGQSVVSQEIGNETKYDHTETVSLVLEEIQIETEEVFVERSVMEKQLVSAGKMEEAEVESAEEEQVAEEIVENVEETEQSSEEIFVEEIPEAEIEPEILLGGEEEVSILNGYAIPTVEEYLNIRSIPSTDGEVVGKLYVGSKAEILEEDGEWYKIQSGTVEGYIYKPYTVTGKDAENHAFENGFAVCEVLTGGLRVRENPGTESDVLDMVGEGEKFSVFEFLDGWVGVDYDGETAYLSSDYVNVDYSLKTAISIEEERAAIQAKKEEEERIAREKQEKVNSVLSNNKAIETVQRENIHASDEDIYLLACLVYMESGYESYEGQLAVANVVLNRLKAGYGNSISEVIYANGQFSGANTGALASILAKGPSQSCVRAAVEALSGVNNIGNYRNFIAASHASYGSYSEYTMIGNHCFYKN